jgi:hypothetical protein
LPNQKKVGEDLNTKLEMRKGISKQITKIPFFSKIENGKVKQILSGGCY